MYLVIGSESSFERSFSFSCVYSGWDETKWILLWLSKAVGNHRVVVFISVLVEWFSSTPKNSEYVLRCCAIALVVFCKDQVHALMPFTIQGRSCFLGEECVWICWETVSFLVSVWPKCSVFLGKVCLDCTVSELADACYPPRWLFSPREVNRLLCSGVPWQRLLLPLPASAEQGCSV